MKIFFSPASPFVRKVMVVAHELGLADQIERLPSAAGPVARDASIRQHNPIGQVPTFFTDDGTVLYDSRVICEYLDDLGGGAFFGSGAARWRNLTDAALGDGLLGAALLARYEAVLRPEPLRWSDWTGGQLAKVTDAVDRMETMDLAGRLDIGTVTFACGLGYLDFRFPEADWRSTHPRTAAWFGAFAQRPSMAATQPGV
ncbi:putative GST-like protein YibF [Methylobacterium crusticola]|uniref:GST-like protein YibF n=1 Tax=Methylobacterium crusticola TaxID=1697972 RepID=A0ABQ4R0C8_9HYPH|nr:glutathione S-transferase [Methylobacterium crusticola]GJD50257.1 putative GST-like protein YibF [Methylobacterium crusticola]